MKLDPESISKIEEFINNHVAKELIISPEGRSIRVNDLMISPNDGKWEILREDEILAIFSLRSWALAYAVAKSSDDKKTSSFLLTSESKLDKLSADKQLYEHHLRTAQDRGDNFKENIINHRLSRTEYEIHGVFDDAHQVVSYQRIA